MAGCSFYTIVNTGSTTADYVFQSCTNYATCDMTATTLSGETYYLNSFNPTLTNQGDVWDREKSYRCFRLNFSETDR